MHKSATKCNEIVGKWCKNKYGASKIIDTFETYHGTTLEDHRLDPYHDDMGTKDEVKPNFRTPPR
jgi:hypothetical protein